MGSDFNRKTIYKNDRTATVHVNIKVEDKVTVVTVLLQARKKLIEVNQFEYPADIDAMRTLLSSYTEAGLITQGEEDFCFKNASTVAANNLLFNK